MPENSENKERTVLGLDVSTHCIGACILVDKGEGIPEIKLLTHCAPKVSNKIKGIQSMFLKKDIFENDIINTLTEVGITDVVIEEPLLSSNNVNTVATLLRFNGIIAESVYRKLNIVPNFISSYDARIFSFPELVALRKYNKKGAEYGLKHIKDAIKKDSIVLFGSYPFDVDKKQVMMDMVSKIYPDIPWIYNAKGELKKENFDACDSLVCALAYININRNGIERPVIGDYSFSGDGKELSYTTKIWDKVFEKKLILNGAD